MLAGRLSESLVGGLGVACIFRATRNRSGVALGVWPALAVYLLFNGATLVAIPEHFGISNGLLSATFLLATRVSDSRKQAGIMAPMVVVAGGLTLTNALYPLGLLASLMGNRVGIKRRWMVLTAVGAVLLGLTGLVAVGSRIAGQVRGSSSIVLRVTNLRLVKEPAAALLYAGHGLIDPAIAPPPRIAGDPAGLSYEPIKGWGFGPLRTPGAIAWLVLLGRSV